MRSLHLLLITSLLFVICYKDVKASITPALTSEQSIKIDKTKILKKRFDHLTKQPHEWEHTEFLNLFFALKDGLKGEELDKLKSQFRAYFEDEMKRYASHAKFNNYHEIAGHELHINQEALKYVENEFGEDAEITKLFQFIIEKVPQADYKIGKSNFIFYEDVPIFIRHHNPYITGVPNLDSEEFNKQPWLAALFYMFKSVNYSGWLSGDYYKTYCNLCFEVLQSPSKFNIAHETFSKSYEGNLKSMLAKVCLKTMCHYDRFRSKEIADVCLKVLISEAKGAYPNALSYELKNIMYILNDKSITDVVMPSTFVEIYYNLLDTYKESVSVDDRIEIIDNCLESFDEIQNKNLKWDYTKMSPLDLLKQKNDIILTEYGKDTDYYIDFITNDVISRFGEYSEEYDIIVNQ